MIKAGIIGATGYTGVELVRILNNHPEVEIAAINSKTYEGQTFSQVFPNTRGFLDKVLTNMSPKEMAAECDVIFTALPHGLSMDVAVEIVKAGKKLVDLGADFRFDNCDTYEQWYKVAHKVQEINMRAPYGLPELNRDSIRKANVVGNPGCFPTSVILGLAPLLANNLIRTETIIADCKSGASGGGRGLNLGFHYAECNENFKAYNIAGKHRHTPEIEQELSKLVKHSVQISFTPHLVPMTRGILSTIYSTLTEKKSVDELLALYNEFYGEEYFVRIHPEGSLPQTKWVYGSNFCDIGIAVDDRTNRVIVVAAIDNLVKGAAGQAVQNMNIMFGIPETTGLELMPIYP